MGKKRWHRDGQEDREALWPLSAQERDISVDVEADRPVPGLRSMLILGTAAYNAWGQRVGKVSANLETLPDATTDDGAMAWWSGQPESWKRARERPQDPKSVMEDFHLFALGYGPRRSGRPVLVAYAPCDAVPINRGTLVFHWCCPNGYKGTGENLHGRNYVHISI